MKIYLLTLGCAKNRVDSECLAGALKAAGHELVPAVEDASAAIVNTCGFIRPAVEESIEAILDLEELKLKGRLEKIGVVGCLVNRYREGLTSEIPSVDFWAETEDWESVLKSLATPLDGARRRGSLPSTPKFTRYLKITEGCGNRCSYCAIPSIRGPLRSLPVDVIVKEAQQLVEEGARELCVVGQDLTVYGMDGGSGGGAGLIELLNALESSLPYDVWIRLLYLHPTRVTPKLLERVGAGRQIIPYLDIPVQHGDPEILALMNRDIKPGALRSIFRTAREINPDFTLRTTCMVGFPGEKKKHFDNLMAFVREVRFDRMGAFIYYAEEGTPAEHMPGQVSEATKKKRLDELMRAQEEISFERQQTFVGRELTVLIDRVAHDEGYAEGRSFREAPEVDGLIEVRSIRKDLKEGDMITVKITEAMPHDMIGEETL
ncbi:30S ribosomal protein S12 methylthiotransferase RimO [Cloacibacillus sp. An23]|uniref:30S ribosomal protein S12 methylthiotransferase RimO n=1 Tax=Cloacibacillus sp. An23 TaxID=1965591 RepID=UPI000B390C2A|nr:30S ribosomal protein S12 methylthiotransferase RimO [Cloacibacillus sp. An23]OUO93673.1 30S ribosomal protein S12 methylthiotransferase RimO [Cloacibacillus sp. An23]